MENYSWIRRSTARNSYLAGQRVVVHDLLEEDRGVANVVAGHQVIGVVHTGWMNREPINYTQWPVVRADELHLRQDLIHVVLVPALHHKVNLIVDQIYNLEIYIIY